MILSSIRFNIRPLTLQDVSERYLAWLNDPDIVRFLNSGRKRHSIYSITEYIEKHDSVSSFHLGIFEKKTNLHIGNYSIYIDDYHRSANINLLIGERAWWGKNVVLETRREILDDLFLVRNLEKVWGTPYAKNIPAVLNYKKQGFSCEGVLRSHKKFLDTERCDVLIFSMQRGDWLDVRRRPLGNP